MNQVEALDKDTPLRDDIRLLGRILGDTVRNQEGEAVFAIGRAHPPDLDPLPPRRGRDGARRARGDAEPLSARADDRDHPRLQLLLAPRQHRRGPAPHPPHPRACPGRLGAARRHDGSVTAALTRAREAGIRAADIRRFFARALVSPVLTAHPTEVQAQEHDRPGDGGRAPAGRARPRPAHARRRAAATRRPCAAPC